MNRIALHWPHCKDFPKKEHCKGVKRQRFRMLLEISHALASIRCYQNHITLGTTSPLTIYFALWSLHQVRNSIFLKKKVKANLNYGLKQGCIASHRFPQLKRCKKNQFWDVSRANVHSALHHSYYRITVLLPRSRLLLHCWTIV